MADKSTLALGLAAGSLALSIYTYFASKKEREVITTGALAVPFAANLARPSWRRRVTARARARRVMSVLGVRGDGLE